MLCPFLTYIVFTNISFLGLIVLSFVVNDNDEYEDSGDDEHNNDSNSGDDEHNNDSSNDIITVVVCSMNIVIGATIVIVAAVVIVAVMK